MNLNDFIREKSDWPSPGILFRDITPLLGNPQATAYAVKQILNPFTLSEIDFIAGPESRGFLFGGMAALCAEKGFIPIRKPGKLPFETIKKSYSLEYGDDCLEIHKDAVPMGSRVLLVDDLLATGGTLEASAELVLESGGVIAGFSVLIELRELKGQALLERFKAPIYSVLQF